jgi:hypothetical protein
MSWKQIDGILYYYESMREGGRHRTVYCGAGARGQIYEQRALERRKRRAVEQENHERKLEAIRAEDHAANEVYQRVESICRTTLERAGFHRPSRKPWRKRRMSTPATTTENGAPYTPAERAEILRTAEERPDDPASKKGIRRILKHEPWHIEISSIESLAMEQLVKKTFGASGLFGTEVCMGTLRKMRKELSRPNQTALEKMLIDRIIFCWMNLYRLEFNSAASNGMTLAASSGLQSTIDRAHRRFLSAVKALAAVRRLDLSGLNLMLANVTVGSDPGKPPETSALNHEGKTALSVTECD